MKNDRRLTLFLASIAALTSLSIDMSLPTSPAVEHDFGLAAGQAGLMMSLFVAGYAVTPLIGGPLADRYGRRPVLFVALMLFGVAAFVCALSTSFAMLLLCRLFQGCASGVATTMPPAIVRDLLEGSAARKRMSEVTTINSAMPILAPILGSVVVRATNWRILFGTQAAFASCILLVLLIGYRETLPVERRHAIRAIDLIHNYLGLLRNRIFLMHALINALGFACIFSFIAVSPLILIQRMGVAPAAYPVLFAAVAVGTILGGGASVILNRREAPVHGIITSGLMIMVAGSLSAISLQGAGYHRPIAILPCVFAALFGYGLISPSVTLEALAPFPRRAGAGSGALRAILMIFGSGISALLATYCAAHPKHVEIVTTLTMSCTALLALALYVLTPLPIASGQVTSRWQRGTPSELT